MDRATAASIAARRVPVGRASRRRPMLRHDVHRRHARHTRRDRPSVHPPRRSRRAVPLPAARSCHVTRAAAAHTRSRAHGVGTRLHACTRDAQHPARMHRTPPRSDRRWRVRACVARRNRCMAHRLLPRPATRTTCGTDRRAPTRARPAPTGNTAPRSRQHGWRSALSPGDNMTKRKKTRAKGQARRAASPPMRRTCDSA